MFIDLLKLQISNHKYQTNPNDQNSKFQTISLKVLVSRLRHSSLLATTAELKIGVCDLFVIWCLKFVILDTKLHGIAKEL